MFEFDFGEIFSHFDDGLTPENGVLQDVGFVDGKEAFVATHRSGEGDASDACDLALAVDHGVDGFDVAVGKFGDRLGLAEINSTGEFAYAEDVEAFRDEFVFDRRGVGQGRVARSGPKIGEEAEVLPEWKKCAALGLDVGRKIFPLGAADGAEEDGIGLFAGCDGVLWERGLVVGGVEGGTANEVVAVGDLEIKFCRGGLEDLQGNIHDFGANAVAGENRDRVGHGRAIAGNDGIENRKD